MAPMGGGRFQSNRSENVDAERNPKCDGTCHEMQYHALRHDAVQGVNGSCAIAVQHRGSMCFWTGVWHGRSRVGCIGRVRGSLGYRSERKTGCGQAHRVRVRVAVGRNVEIGVRLRIRIGVRLRIRIGVRSRIRIGVRLRIKGG